MRNRQLSVSALVRYLKGKLDQDSLIQRIVVAGEISNFTAHRSGHCPHSVRDVCLLCAAGRISAQGGRFGARSGQYVGV